MDARHSLQGLSHALCALPRASPRETSSVRSHAEPSAASHAARFACVHVGTPLALRLRAIDVGPSPSSSAAKMPRTTDASCGCTSNDRPSLRYPYGTRDGRYVPASNRRWMPHFTFADSDRDSSCASADNTESISSDSSRSVWMFSFSNHRATPSDVSCRVIVRQSAVLRANRDKDLVMTRSTSPLRQSAMSLCSSGRVLALVALTPDSA